VRWWYATAIVLLVLAVAAVIALRMQKPVADDPQTTTTTAPPIASGTTVTVEPATTVVTPIDSGRLLINAFPWGEVTSVLDASGEEQLIATTETPLMMSLPAGAYRVRLTNPNSNRSVVLDATVVANALSRCETQLDSIDASRYVDGLGLGR
jgi:hypothetical protein